MAKRLEGSSYQTIADIFSEGEAVADPFGVCSGGIFVFSTAMSASLGLTFRLSFFSSPLFSTEAAAGLLLFTGLWFFGGTGLISSRVSRAGSVGIGTGAAC